MPRRKEKDLVPASNKYGRIWDLAALYPETSQNIL